MSESAALHWRMFSRNHDTSGTWHLHQEETPMGLGWVDLELESRPSDISKTEISVK